MAQHEEKTGKHEAGDVTLTAAEYEALKEKAAKSEEHWDKIVRLNADFDNAKKRLEKRSQDLVKFANEQFLVEMLPVVDDLDRAMASLDQGHDLEKVKQGLHLVQNTFHKVLAKNGVEPIESAGQPFDPNLHEAVGETVTDKVDEGHIAEELQKGYMLHGRLARPSRVRVAKRK
jgi:molecular chaperone GrpE